jgi:CheY-like chemotaxis protein/nitrogen-specific signal transduction histidine kinase
MVRTKPKKKSAAQRSRRRPLRRGAAIRTTEAALAAFAHDIRTSLTGILALGELLASSNLGERERRWAAGIKTSAEHLAALTTLAIDAAKADAGALTLQQQAFRPRRLIDALSDTLSARAETKGLTAEVTVAADLPEMLVGDAARLRAAIENLIDNAVKFTERGTVRLEVRASRGARGKIKLRFTVTDSGIGLKRAEIKRLFRPFTQANAEIARRYGGAGLGLAVVKSLAKLMGGDLTVTSTPGRGASFRLAIVLPIAAADTSATTHAQQTKTPTRRLAVLCAEDNPYGRVILNTILTELGHRADFVASGEEAVEAVKRGYEVVLMDVTLPGIDGLEATRRIRALAETASRTPIVGISGRTEIGDEEAARAAGMDSYLRKPISPSALSEAIAIVVPAQPPRGDEKASLPGRLL